MSTPNAEQQLALATRMDEVREQSARERDRARENATRHLEDLVRECNRALEDLNGEDQWVRTDVGGQPMYPSTQTIHDTLRELSRFETLRHVAGSLAVEKGERA